MNLTIRLRQIPYRPPADNFYTTSTEWPHLICDRCHDVEALVVAIMEVSPLEETWALCGACESELPVGFTQP